MTYAEYLITFQGYLRAYYHDIAKHRATAYQVFAGRNPNISITRFMPLPIDDLSAYDPEKIKIVRNLFLEKLRKEKYGKCS